MKLYHGFRNFEKILTVGKLQCISLQGFANTPNLAYISPSLLYVAGKNNIIPTNQFNEGTLILAFAPDISKTAKENFKVDLPVDTILTYGNKLNKEYLTDRSEYYRTKGIYLAHEPIISRDNHLVLDVPEKLIQPSPPGFPLVAGELSLEHVTNLLIKKEYTSIITQILEKYNKQFKIDIY